MSHRDRGRMGPPTPAGPRAGPWAVVLARLLRTFFTLLYTRWAWAYDWVAWASSVGQWRTWQRIALEGLPEGRVLELGHGPGHLLLDLARQGRKPAGIDASRQMAALARRRFASVGQPPVNALATAGALPFASGTFSIAIAAFPSEFILDHRTISEVFRTLRPEAELIVIPAAEITGRSGPDRAAGWLYRTTQQSGPFVHAWTEALSSAGAAADLEQIPLPRARVWRIRIRRHAP